MNILKNTSAAGRIDIANELLNTNVISTQEEYFAVISGKGITASPKHVWELIDYFDNIGPDTTVEEWLGKDIEERHLEQYPNAVKAKNLMDSKLWKVLK